MVDTVKIIGLTENEHESGYSSVSHETGAVVGHSPAAVAEAGASCTSDICQSALKLGLPSDIAQKITASGLAAYRQGVPADRCALFETTSQVSALVILGEESWKLALTFKDPNKFDALALLGKGGTEVAQQVDSSAQVEAMRLILSGNLGINVTQALKVSSYAEVIALQSMVKGYPAKAVNAGAPILRANEFHCQAQVDAIPLTNSIDTALRFVHAAQVEALRRQPSLPIARALDANDLIISAMDVNMTRTCAWNVTSEHQIAAYQAIMANRLDVNDICAASLSFNTSDQLYVLNATGNVAKAIPFHNMYARLALAAGIDVETSGRVDNEHALAAAANHSVRGNLTANFTRPEQVLALDRGLMSHEEAAATNWCEVLLRMSFGNYFKLGVCPQSPYVWPLIPTVFIVGSLVLVKYSVFGIGAAAAFVIRKRATSTVGVVGEGGGGGGGVKASSRIMNWTWKCLLRGTAAVSQRMHQLESKAKRSYESSAFAQKETQQQYGAPQTMEPSSPTSQRFSPPVSPAPVYAGEVALRPMLPLLSPRLPMSSPSYPGSPRPPTTSPPPPPPTTTTPPPTTFSQASDSFREVPLGV